MGRHSTIALYGVLLFGCFAVHAQTGWQEQSLPLKVYGQHLIVVRGSIGALHNRNLVVDTGAYPSVIDRYVARNLGLSGPEEKLDAIDQTLSRPAVSIPALHVGPIHATAVRGLVDDLSPLSKRFGVRVDALVGLDVLGHTSFRIDYEARRIFFGAVDALPSWAPFELADSKICVALRANGKPVRLLVDTGAEKTLLLGSRLPWLAAQSDDARLFNSLAGSFVLRQVRLDTLQLADTSLNAQPIYVSSARTRTYLPFDGFLSTAQFRQIAFDFERQQFSWTTWDRRMDRVRVASGSSSAPAHASTFAGHSNGESIAPADGCKGRVGSGFSCEPR